MQGTKCRRIVSLLVVLCMVVSLLPMAVIADDTKPTYEYVGARLDKEYDGTAVSVDVTKDIAVDGKTGVLTTENSSVGWQSEAGGLNMAPSDAGAYTMELYVTDESGYSSTVLTVDFVIWEKGHVHTFDGCEPDENGLTHTHSCTECGYETAKPHNFGEWQEVSSYDAPYEYRQCADCNYIEKRSKITYDYATNGGTSATVSEKYTDTYTGDVSVDLTPTAVKSGYEFVGWNTDPDAHEALKEYSITANMYASDTTLYAIFKKT